MFAECQVQNYAKILTFFQELPLLSDLFFGLIHMSVTNIFFSYGLCFITWQRGNVWDLYSRGTWFETLRDDVYPEPKDIRCFTEFLHRIAGIVTRPVTLPYQVSSNSSFMYHPNIPCRRDQCFSTAGTSNLSGTRDMSTST